MKVIHLQKLLTLLSVSLLLCASSVMSMEKEQENSFQIAPYEGYEQVSTLHNPFASDTFEPYTPELFQRSSSDSAEQYTKIFDPLDVPTVSQQSQSEQTADHGQQPSYYDPSLDKEDYGSFVIDHKEESSVEEQKLGGHKAGYYFRQAAIEKYNSKKALAFVEETIETLIDYNTDGKNFYARFLLLHPEQELTKLTPGAREALQDTFKGIQEIICYSSGRFKESLNPQELKEFKQLYIDYLDRTHSERGYAGHCEKLARLAAKDDLFKKALDSYKSKESSDGFFSTMSEPLRTASDGLKKLYNKHIYDVSREAQHNNVNKVGALIASYIKDGHYELALQLGEAGYFKKYPALAEVIKNDCKQLMQERDAQRTILDQQKKESALTLFENALKQQKDQLEQIGRNYKQLTAKNTKQAETIEKRVNALDQVLGGNVKYTVGTASIGLSVKKLLSNSANPKKIENFYGNQIQHVAHKEIATILNQVALIKERSDSPKTAQLVNSIVAYTLQAREAIDRGDIASSFACADKAWALVYKDATKNRPLSEFASPSGSTLTPKTLVKSKDATSLDKPAQLTPHLLKKKDYQLLPQVRQELKERGINIDKLTKPTHRHLALQKKQREFIERINATVLAKEQAKDIKKRLILGRLIDADIAVFEYITTVLTEKELYEAGQEADLEMLRDFTDECVQVIDVARAQIADNIKHPLEYAKRSFVEPGISLIEWGLLSPFERGQKVAECVLQGINSIETFYSLPKEQKSEITGKLLGDVLTGAIVGEIVSAVPIPKTIQTVEEAEQLIERVKPATFEMVCDDLKKTCWVVEQPAVVEHAKKGADFAKKLGDLPLVPKLPSVVEAPKPALPVPTVHAITKSGSDLGKTVATVAQTTNTAQRVGEVGKAPEKTEQVAQEVSTASQQTVEIGEKAGKTGNIVEGQFKPLGRGSTGRSVPENLHEQVALREIMSDPSQGKKIDINKGKGMTDPRWHQNDDWYKRAWHSEELDKDIHYVTQEIDGVITAVDDFKFIDK